MSEDLDTQDAAGAPGRDGGPREVSLNKVAKRYLGRDKIR